MRSAAYEQGRRFAIHNGAVKAVPHPGTKFATEFLRGAFEGVITRGMITRAEGEDVRRRRKQAEQFA